MSGHLESKDCDSVEFSSADDVSSYAPPRQAFGDFETKFPGVTVGAADDPAVYDTQVFIIPEGTYAMDAMLFCW